MDDVKPVHRYKAQTMFSFGGAKIEYFPHGPEVVLATEFDAQRLRADTAEAERDKYRKVNDSLMARNLELQAAEQRIAELTESLSSAWLPPDDKDMSLFGKLLRDVNNLKADKSRMEALLNTPHTADWFEGVKLEAGHQIQRWGSDHDAGKGPADWFWLIGYLAQKAMTSQMAGNEEKARHHTISTGAALLNWFRAITGDSNAMRPGIDDAALNPNPEAGSNAAQEMSDRIKSSACATCSSRPCMCSTTTVLTNKYIVREG